MGLIFLIFIAVSSNAGEFSYAKKVDPSAFDKYLKDNGFQVLYTECRESSCKTIFSDLETKDPMPFLSSYVYIDPNEQQNQLRAQIILLAKKLKSGSASAAERDALLLKICQLILSVD